MIGGVSVLTSTELGASITNSSLTSLGTLSSLTVDGDIKTRSITINNLSVTDTGIDVGLLAKVTVQGQDVFYGDRYQVVLGDIEKQTNPVKVFGKLSVNINNPDPTVSFSVSGDISISDKRFTNGTGAPTEGTWHNGDICWNKNPLPNSYIGWVCIVAGSPGQWTSFGLIADQ